MMDSLQQWIHCNGKFFGNNMLFCYEDFTVQYMSWKRNFASFGFRSASIQVPTELTFVAIQSYRAQLTSCDDKDADLCKKKV